LDNDYKNHAFSGIAFFCIIFNSLMPAIFCNQCRVLVLKTSNNACLSCGAENWGYKDETTVEKATILTPYSGDGVSGYTLYRQKKRSGPVFLFSSIAAALFIIFILAVPVRNIFKSPTGTRNTNRVDIPSPSCNLSQSAIYEQYKYSVGLIWHEYVYEVKINGSKPVEFTRNRGGQFVLREDGGAPITVTGTGFFADSAGLIITNKHVAAPWTLNRGETRQLRTLITAFLQKTKLPGSPSAKIRAGWRKKQLMEPDSGMVAGDSSAASLASAKDTLRIEIKPKSSFLGLALQDMQAEKKNYIQCLVVDTDPVVDLAILRTLNGQTPPNTGYVNLRSSIINMDSLKPGSRAVMVGFPMGMDLARGSNGKIRIQVQEGFINNESDERQILYNIPSAHGASGSPVFNDCGKLIAVNYAGYDGHPFNLGIPAKHVMYLVGHLRLAESASPKP
jgi:S1-C subfamily serine protease